MMRHIVHRELRKLDKILKTDTVYLTKNGGWLTIGNGLQLIIGLVSSVILANVLEPAELGIYKFVFTLAGLFGGFLLTGIGTSAAQSIASGYLGSMQAASRLSIKWSFVFIILSLGASGYYLYQGDAILGYSMLIVGTLFPVIQATSLYGSFYKGTKQFGKLVVFDLVRTVLPIAAVITVALTTKSIIGLIAAYYGVSIVVTSAFYLYTKQLIPQDAEAKDEGLGAYGKHLTAMKVIDNVSTHVDKLLVFQAIDAGTLATYTVARMPTTRVQTFFKSIKTLLLTRYAERTLASISRSATRKALLLFGFSLCIVIVYILSAPWLFSTLFPKYPDAILLTQISILGLLASPSIAYGQALTAHRKTSHLYIQTSITSVSRIVFVLVGFWYGSVLGIVTALVLNRFFALALTMLIFRHAVKTSGAEPSSPSAN